MDLKAKLRDFILGLIKDVDPIATGVAAYAKDDFVLYLHDQRAVLCDHNLFVIYHYTTNEFTIVRGSEENLFDMLCGREIPVNRGRERRE